MPDADLDHWGPLSQKQLHRGSQEDILNAASALVNVRAWNGSKAFIFLHIRGNHRPQLLREVGRLLELDILGNNQLLQIRHEKMPLKKAKHQLRVTAQKHPDQPHQNIPPSIFRS